MFTWNKVLCHAVIGNTVYYYDYAEYLGELIPDRYPFKFYKIKTGCFLLKSGRFAWSFNCEVYDKEELQGFELVKIPPPVDIQPLITHIIYDDYERMQKMKRKYSLRGLIDIYSKTKIRNVKFQHD